MSRKLINSLATTSIAAALALATSRTASAVPVVGQFVDDSRCDTVPTQFLSHELGKQGFFPINESIAYQVSAATFTICVPNDGVANDWIVDMVNTSGLAWTNLFFVCDQGMNVGNADGLMQDVINAPGVFTDAFRIDSIGINGNLLGESQINDGIFAPGESWRFNVSNFTSFPGTPPFQPIFTTPAKFAGSDPIVIPPINTASILATPVPEPATIGAVGLVVTSFLMRRPSRPRRRRA